MPTRLTFLVDCRVKEPQHKTTSFLLKLLERRAANIHRFRDRLSTWYWRQTQPSKHRGRTPHQTSRHPVRLKDSYLFDKKHECHQLSQVGFKVQHSYFWYPSPGNIGPNVIPSRSKATSDLRKTMGGIKCVVFLPLLRHWTGAARPLRALVPVKNFKLNLTSFSYSLPIWSNRLIQKLINCRLQQHLDCPWGVNQTSLFGEYRRLILSCIKRLDGVTCHSHPLKLHNTS